MAIDFNFRGFLDTNNPTRAQRYTKKVLSKKMWYSGNTSPLETNALVLLRLSLGLAQFADLPNFLEDVSSVLKWAETDAEIVLRCLSELRSQTPSVPGGSIAELVDE